jgi:hypothetical protein
VLNVMRSAAGQSTAGLASSPNLRSAYPAYILATAEAAA